MARSTSRSQRVVVRQSYYWPDQQLNFWIIVMLAAAGTLIGTSAIFFMQQNRLGLGVPWILPYGITIGALTVLFIIVMLVLIYQRRLLPGVVIIGSFILAVLYLTGLIETAIQLFGPVGDINGNCQQFVTGHGVTGVSVATLAWLEQSSTCQSWLAAFAFWIVGTVFLVWMIVLASLVAQGRLGRVED